MLYNIIYEVSSTNSTEKDKLSYSLEFAKPATEEQALRSLCNRRIANIRQKIQEDEYDIASVACGAIDYISTETWCDDSDPKTPVFQVGVKDSELLSQVAI